MQAIAEDAANKFSIPKELVSAIIGVESSWDTWAFNPEPHYRYMWDVDGREAFRELTSSERASQAPPADFSSPAGVPLDAEWWAQQASWGLMQVMGGTARWMGMRNPWLTQLLEPGTGVEYGCRYLRYHLDRSGGDKAAAVAAYNAGSAVLIPGGNEYKNQAYVDKVFRLYLSSGADGT